MSEPNDGPPDRRDAIPSGQAASHVWAGSAPAAEPYQESLAFGSIARFPTVPAPEFLMEAPVTAPGIHGVKVERITLARQTFVNCLPLVEVKE
jgi:hypothetical protein